MFRHKLHDSEENMNQQLSKIQNDIIQLYFETFKKYDGGLGLSIPHIPRISMNYLMNRTIIVGQETNTWYGVGLNQEDNLKDLFDNHPHEIEKYCLDEAYDPFIRECAAQYGGKFWDFNRLLYKEKIIDGEMINGNTLSHCWINLFAVEACKDKADKWGTPTANRALAAKVLELQSDLLHKVFEILRPKCIIFLTGASNDEALFKTAITTEMYVKKAIDTNGVLNEHELVQIIVNDVDDVLHNTKIVRTYHPSYFLSRINVYKSLQGRKEAQGISISNSEYYKKVLFDFLKSQISE